MKYKIAIFGSSAGNIEIVRAKAEALGRELAKHDVMLITGACSGVPYMVVHEAAKRGVEVWGFSPEIDLKHQKLFTPEDDLSIYKKIEYTPKEFPFINENLVAKKYRNVISTATTDAGIIVSGRWGTMNEFTNLHDMGKVIGVLTGTGGIADELENLMKKISKPSKAKVMFNDSPTLLIELILEELKKISK